MNACLTVGLTVLGSLVGGLLFASSVGAAEIETNKILISEVKLGGNNPVELSSETPRQYVELHNVTNQAINLDGWRIEYAKPAFSSAYCESDNWTAHAVSSSATQQTLVGEIPPTTSETVGLVVVEMSLNDAADGSLRLVHEAPINDVTIHDQLHWGQTAPCASLEGDNVLATPQNGKSIDRYLDCDNEFITIGGSNDKFSSNQSPSPGRVGELYKETCVPDEPVVYLEVWIKELLPDPDTAAGQTEFIELYNPNLDTVNIGGYILRTSSGSNNSLILPDVEVASGGYYIANGLTLTNSGGSAWIEDPNGIKVSETALYSSAKKGQSWAEINDSWQVADPTPGESNKALIFNDEPDSSSSTDELEACPAGKFRNPETNRCKNIVSSASALVPCKPGQVRNADTNRCRSILSAANSLTPCRPGQTRNPETNRCRNATAASATLKPCSPGQERNPATNRCRNIQNVSSSTTDIKSDNTDDTAATQAGWWLAGLAGLGIIGYGVYEWRNELFDVVQKFRG